MRLLLRGCQMCCYPRSRCFCLPALCHRPKHLESSPRSRSFLGRITLSSLQHPVPELHSLHASCMHRWALQEALQNLEMPRFTRRYPAILDTLMKQMLGLVQVCELPRMHPNGSDMVPGTPTWIASKESVRMAVCVCQIDEARACCSPGHL